MPDAETKLAILLAVTPDALRRACATAAKLAPGFEAPGEAEEGG